MTSTVVVGAGPAGLTFAIAAVARGRDVVVHDERPALGGGAGIVLWPNALAALDRVGLDAVRDLGEPVAAATLRRGDGGIVRRIEPVRMIRALGEPPRVVDRTELQALLADILGHDRLRLASGGREPVGDLVIGADGYRSVVARRLDPTMTERYAGYVAWRGIADRRPDPGWTGVVWGHGGEAGLLPLPGGRTYWFLTRRGAADRTTLPLDGWPAEIAEVVAATPSDAVSCLPMLDRSVPRHWHDASSVLIGDAAHAMQPGLGQGGCTAIEDAVALAARLGAGPAAPAVLAAFVRQRRRRVLPMVSGARATGRFLHGDHVDRVLPLARYTPLGPPLAVLARIASYDAGRRAVVGRG